MHSNKKKIALLKSSKCGLTAGFTLVEMSIVIVIIGLLVAGILVGRDMVKSAELNSTVSKAMQYSNIAQLFRDKYNAFPGDMFDAEDKFGAGLTDNGNGNGRIEGVSEIGQAWVHLSLSGLIKDEFDGSSTFTGPIVSGGNVPSASMNKAVFLLTSELDDGTSTVPHIGLGKISGTVANFGAFISPARAYVVDKKIDDGKPATGDVHSENGSSATGTCVTINVVGREYTLNNNEVACKMRFYILTQSNK